MRRAKLTPKNGTWGGYPMACRRFPCLAFAMRESQFLQPPQSAAMQPPQMILQINWKEGIAKRIRIRHLQDEMAIMTRGSNLKLRHKQRRDGQLALEGQIQKAFLSRPGRRAV